MKPISKTMYLAKLLFAIGIAVRSATRGETPCQPIHFAVYLRADRIKVLVSGCEGYGDRVTVTGLR